MFLVAEVENHFPLSISAHIRVIRSFPFCMKIDRKRKLSSSHPGAGAAARAAEDDRQPQHEAEVVPAAVIVRFVDVDVAREKGYDERHRQDDAVPQAEEKTGGFLFIVGHVFHRIRAGRAGDEKAQAEEKRQYLHRFHCFAPFMM